jgi:hypothetical protein
MIRATRPFALSLPLPPLSAIDGSPSSRGSNQSPDAWRRASAPPTISLISVVISACRA